MKRTIRIILLSVCFSLSALRASTDQGGMILGPGALSCGKFLTDKKQLSSGEAQYLQWSYGFVSGINHVTGGNVGVNVDRFAWMKQLEHYCSEHPLDMFVDAVIDLQAKLSQEHKK